MDLTGILIIGVFLALLVTVVPWISTMLFEAIVLLIESIEYHGMGRSHEISTTYKNLDK